MGIHHFWQTSTPTSLFDDVNKMVKKRPWNVKKNKQSWKISRLRVSSLVSFLAMRRPERSSSLCNSFRSKRWPGDSEISISGWSWMAEMALMAEIICFWCSPSTGISTRWWWRSFISAINEFEKLKKKRKSNTNKSEVIRFTKEMWDQVKSALDSQITLRNLDDFRGNLLDI